MKKLLTLLLAFAIVFTLVPVQAYAASDPLKSKAVYYTPASDYKSGDCILTSSKNMIRRTMIMNDTGYWKKVTNKKLRKTATIAGLLWNKFDYDAEGLVISVNSGLFTGKGDSARIKEIEDLLRVHPEGIVVHGTGAASTGTHGVLALEVRNGVIYAADSTHNTGLNNKGIQKWKNTTMLNPSKVSKYWYISGVSTSTKTSPSKNPQKSKLRVEAPQTPTKIKQGKGFGIWGEVKSDKKIKLVTVRILDRNGNTVVSVTKKPGKKVFKIVSVDDKIPFGSLQKGSYTYQVIAKDTEKMLVLVNKQFNVV